MSDTVAKQSAAMAAMVQASAKGRALVSGTSGMRDAGKKYMPKYPVYSADLSGCASLWLLPNVARQ